MSTWLTDLGKKVISDLPAKIIITLLLGAGTTVWLARKRLRVLWRCLVIGQGRRLRVSCAEILMLVTADRYVLVRSLHRPACFNPLGGVIKYLPSEIGSLKAIGFEPESVAGEAERDLRGKLPSVNVFKLLAWLEDGTDGRETNALTREIREELKECGFPELATRVGDLHFHDQRLILEGPVDVAGETYQQLRVMRVRSFNRSDPHTRAIADEIVELARQGPNLIMATEAEIIRGITANNQLIASHSSYLFGEKKHREDTPRLPLP